MKLHRIPAPVLVQAMRRALAARDIDAMQVDDIVDTLISTSLDGIDTHGVRLLGTYLKELDGGRSKARPALQMQTRLPALTLLDADGALGVVAGNAAIRHAILRAREFGIAAVAVCNSNHFGAAGYYAGLAAAAGLVGLAFSNSDALVAPFNGARAMIGTNPLAMAAPGLDGDRFYLDMATSQVAYSRVMHYTAHRVALAPGWACNANGGDAAVSGEAAALLPLGGYKGQGLGMMVQILSALLVAMPFDHTLSPLYSPPYDAPRQIGHFFIAIDPAALGDVEAFRGRVTGLLDALRGSPHATEPVIVPGDKERAARRERLALGIPLDDDELRVFAPYLADVSENAVSPVFSEPTP